MSREFDIYKIVKTGLKAMKRAKIPLYWRKYSRKDYTKHHANESLFLIQFLEKRSFCNTTSLNFFYLPFSMFFEECNLPSDWKILNSKTWIN